MQLLSEDDFKKQDYQIKTGELVKEVLFLRQYGVKNQDSSNPQKEKE